MSKKRENSGYSAYYPKHWPIWLILGICRLLVFLPYPILMKIGRWTGRQILRFSGKARKTALINLRLCFPALSPQERENLLQKNFESVGCAFFETCLSWWATNAQLCNLCHIHGLENLENALKKNKGVLFCSAHFLTLELCGRLFVTQLPEKQPLFGAMYRPQKNYVLDKIAYHYRKNLYQKIIARDDLRGMLKWLKANKIFWYTPDIDAGINNSIFVPFFGVPAASITATTRLAEISNATVVPIFCYRRDDNSGYDICIEPALENYPSGNIENDTARINQIIEIAIRKKPEEYLWQYQRFKTRPEGEKRFY